MKRDLTTGSVFKTIVYFSLPYLLSYFLQTLYGMADLFIIGQFNGLDSTTAVSIGSQVMHMLTVTIVGLAMGSTVMIARAVGGKDLRQASRAIGNTITLFMLLSVACTIVLLLAVRPITAVMSTPSEAVDGTVRYLTICFIGIPFITAYNIISSIFRGMGDSKSPMYFIAIACTANIALDYLFIGFFHLDTVGAALGTTLSQTISVLVSLAVIRKRQLLPAILPRDFRPNGAVLGNILKVGIPVAVQDSLIQISFLIITVFANRRGINDAAAVGIVEKIISVLFLVPSSMLSAVSALCAQNIGAERHDRARQTMRYAIMIAVSFGAVIAVAMQFLGAPAVSLFTNNPETILLGGQYMHGYVWDCIFAGIHFCFSGYFCAYGLSLLSFIHNFIATLCLRIPLSYLAATHFPDTLFPMGLASPAGSTLSVIICVAVYFWMNRTLAPLREQKKH
ncbi:MAG: MATE family efflux transporter [Evtepia sp.]|uniref:MATE family efflux transporter n=1 Tax=Evtepia sp. TaxID=2773933 RepID=UPI002A756675|nr:MATE family efflux transporter [Evtepia sp.]MDY3013860.1 MATE family efflux transporter [Evtepia sp.]